MLSFRLINADAQAPLQYLKCNMQYAINTLQLHGLAVATTTTMTLDFQPSLKALFACDAFHTAICAVQNILQAAHIYYKQQQCHSHAFPGTVSAGCVCRVCRLT